MFEDKTSAVIHKEILDDISSEYDKTDGSFIFDATEPPADQLEKAYQSASKVADLIDVNNLFDDELEKFVNQRTGQERRKATFAIGTVEVTGNGSISVGDLFQTDTAVQFTSTEYKAINGTGTVNIRAVLPGDIGNVPTNQITVIPISLNGINTVTNILPTSEGYEEESDEDLRERYLERVRTPATSGNIYHYRNWAKEVPGVGEVKIVPLWDGDNTVKVILIDSYMQPATALLVEQVQNHIDPGGTGLGDGQAPIGAFCTVVSATGKPIHLSFSATLEAGYSVETVTQNVITSLSDYLKTIAFSQGFVSYAQIGSLILDSEGVIDYTNLTVNEGITNVPVANDEVAILGGVTIVE